MGLRSFWHSLYLNKRLFVFLGSLTLLFVFGFFIPLCFVVARVLVIILLLFLLVDGLVLYQKEKPLLLRRRLPKVFSLSDFNKVYLEVENLFTFAVSVSLIDELPVQFQKRDFSLKLHLPKGEKMSVHYQLRPVERGVYAFGALHAYISSPLGLIQRRFSLEEKAVLPVYPSIIQMKRYAFLAFDRVGDRSGIRKMRRIGHSYEFDQIKEYVKGDDYRHINWKATGRRHRLMVNHYQEERSQNIYCILDKGRIMHMPFEGLTLLDYAVNASLALLNIVLLKHDKAGLLTFSDKLGDVVMADKKPGQLSAILQSLYHQRHRIVESHFELLYQATRMFIKQRSLLILFTNFESHHALDRALPLLRRINLRHILLVVFFENTEVEALAMQPVEDVEGIYTRTQAQHLIHSKYEMVQKLQHYGLQALLVKPSELSVGVINKYLELKARGLI